MKKKIISTILMLTVFLNTSIIANAKTNDNLDQEIYNKLLNREETFVIDYDNVDILDKIENISKKDDYLNLSIKQMNCSVKTTIKNNNKTSECTINMSYLANKNQEEYVDQAAQIIVNTIIKPNMTEYEKVKTINSFLINYLSYDYSLSKFSAYDSLTTKQSVCMGYTLTAYKLLEKSGIENKIITGTLKGTPHSWNLVKVNNQWYHLDVTNNDSLGENKFLLVDNKTLLNYDFVWDTSLYPTVLNNYK